MDRTKRDRNTVGKGVVMKRKDRSRKYGQGKKRKEKDRGLQVKGGFGRVV